MRHLATAISAGGEPLKLRVGLLDITRYAAAMPWQCCVHFSLWRYVYRIRSISLAHITHNYGLWRFGIFGWTSMRFAPVALPASEVGHGMGGHRGYRLMLHVDATFIAFNRMRHGGSGSVAEHHCARRKE